MFNIGFTIPRWYTFRTAQNLWFSAYDPTASLDKKNAKQTLNTDQCIRQTDWDFLYTSIACDIIFLPGFIFCENLFLGGEILPYKKQGRIFKI